MLRYWPISEIGQNWIDAPCTLGEGGLYIYLCIIKIKIAQQVFLIYQNSSQRFISFWPISDMDGDILAYLKDILAYLRYGWWHIGLSQRYPIILGNITITIYRQYSSINLKQLCENGTPEAILCAFRQFFFLFIFNTKFISKLQKMR